MNQQELLVLNHEIRYLESSLRLAKRRYSLLLLSILFGPVLLLVLYTMWVLPWIPDNVTAAVAAPGLLLALFGGLSTLHLRRRGGPEEVSSDGRKGRRTEAELELEIARRREEKKHLLAREDTPTKVRRVAYKEDARADIEKFRQESRRFRRVNNILQGVLIVGSLAATGAAGAAAEIASVRWLILGITFLVGISGGFMGYFKYKERSFYLQQTADAIEHEWEALEIGVGRYRKSANEEEALAEFVEEVHRLKSEQKKRQQNLEQPPDLRSHEQG